MKILHINFSMTMGGIDNMLVDIINEQSKKHDVSVLIINDHVDSLVSDKINERVDFIRFGRRKKSRNLYKLIKLNLLINKLSPDIIHCHNSKIVNLLFFTRCPIVLTVHDIGYDTNDYKKFDKIFAISEAVRKDIQYRGYSGAETVYNGVDSKKIKIKNDFNIKELKIVCISRLEHLKKGQDLLIEALSKISNKNIKIDFIGDGSSKDYLINLVKKNNLDDQIKFRGKLSRNVVHNILSDYDLLIQPSRKEGFGITIIEAMIAKVLVLVSDIEGPNEIISNGKYGFNFKNNDIIDLSLQINNVFDILVSKNEIMSFINNAHNYAVKNFEIEVTSENYIKKYNNIF